MKHCVALWARRVRSSVCSRPQVFRHISSIALLALLVGCATGNNADIHHFQPMPRVEVGQAELGPVSTRPVSQLLREAEQAYRAANDAHSRGDRAGAMREYKVMLDRLAEAEIDPSVFYSLRSKLDGMSADGLAKAPHRGAISGLAGSGKYNDIEIPFPLPERVLVEIDEIMTVYPKGFQAGLDRAQKYMPYIRAELRKAGLPEELGWLCMVESQFNVKIDSHAGAGGMWQFMPATAKRYNLRMDTHVDERYNWKSATQSAIAMLKYHHDFFDGDWALAIAAYNMGEGGLRRAIEANGGQKDFWRLIETPPASDRIKRETKKYYPRFLATVIVASNPARYGFKVNPAPPDNTVRVPVPAMYALSDLDQAMGLPNGTLAMYNRDLIAEVTPPSGDYAVYVPAELRNQFVAALAATPTVNSTRFASAQRGTSKPSQNHAHQKNHRVKRGETLASLAKIYGVSVEELKRENRLKSSHIRVNQTLKIPGGAGAPTLMADARGGNSAQRSGEDAARSAQMPAVPEAATFTYTVVRGDTLHGISQRYGVSVADIQARNKMEGKTTLNVGQKLLIASNNLPAGAAPARGGAEPIGLHVVQAGEYPAKIAREHNMSLTEFLALNDLSDGATIREGQELKVRAGGGGGAQRAEAKPAEPLIHTVVRGETASSIAAKHGVPVADLLAWNGLTKTSVLRIGQQCKVYPKGTVATAASSGEVKVASKREPKTHVVSAGHNPTSIARQYGVSVSDLFSWNGWSKNHVLRVGDKVLIYD